MFPPATLSRCFILVAHQYLCITAKVLSELQAVQIKQSSGVVEAVLLQAVTYALLESLPADTSVT